MKNKIVGTFLEYDFKEKNDQFVLERYLFDDFKVTVNCEKGWFENGFINFYIYSDSFASFIETVFSSVSNANLIQPRKLTKDRTGCLCMVSTPIETIEGEWVIWLNGEQVRLCDLLSLFSETQSIEDFYESLYFRSNRYFIWVETIWVYLFLKKRIGINSAVEIYRDMNQETMTLLVKRWNIKSEPSVDSLEIIMNIG